MEACESFQDRKIARLVSHLDTQFPDTVLESSAREFEKSFHRLPSSDEISEHWLALGSKEQWAAFGQLQFPKRHLILKYFSQDVCMRILSAEYLHMFKDMELYAVEDWLQHKSGKTKERRIFHEGSEVNSVHYRYICEIDKDARVSSMDMIMEREGSPLQRAFGEENVLRVNFGFTTNEAEKTSVGGALRRLFTKGLQIGLRTYKFYGMKADQRKKKHGILQDNSPGYKCTFLCLWSEAEHDLHSSESFGSYTTIHDARQYLGHFHTVPKLSTRRSRMELALSKTLQISDLDFSKLQVQEIEDICCKDQKGRPLLGVNGESLITTDGTGFISENLMRKCPLSVCEGKKLTTQNIQEDYPLLMQMRLFHKGNIYKGVLLVNRKLPPNTIQVRPSMRKVKNDPSILSPTFDSLEVCGTSRRPTVANLFRHLILLLLYGGVPEDIFMKLAQETLEDLTSCYRKLPRACKVLQPYIYEKLECQVAFQMLLAEIKVEEPFVTRVLKDMRSSQLNKLSICYFPVEGTYYLKGCADPTCKLAPTQVVILKEQPVIAEEVLVYKPPGLHPGDVRKFQAVPPPPGLKDIIGSARFGIFFSVLGERSEVDKMANADLDGDEFWICENQEIVRHFEVSPPWTVPKKDKGAAKPKEAPCELEAFEREHVKLCIDTLLEPSFIKGQAANAWLAFMDNHISLWKAGLLEGPLIQKCLKLVDIYYEALDAEKTGEKVPSLTRDLRNADRPHFMDKNSTVQDRTYVSSSVLGLIYDMVKNPSTVFVPPEVPIEMDKRFMVPGYEQYSNKWSKLVESYNDDMKQACSESNSCFRNSLCDELIHKYRQKLYGAINFSSSRHDMSQMRMEASAIYMVVYSRAQRYQDNGWAARVRFAWIIAGDVLIDIIKKPGWWNVSPVVMAAVYGRARFVDASEDEL